MVLFTVVTLFGLWVIQGLIIHFLTPVIMNVGFTEELALLASKLVATVASLIWNYLLYSRVVFKHKN
jgi:putative flippase GtrA